LAPGQVRSELGLATVPVLEAAAAADRPEVTAKVGDLGAPGEVVRGAALPPLPGG
jgi:hypothetical protein